MTVVNTSLLLTSGVGSLLYVNFMGLPGITESYTDTDTPVVYTVAEACLSTRYLRTGNHSLLGPVVCHETCNTSRVPAGIWYVVMAGWKLNSVEPTANNSGYTDFTVSLIACATTLRGNMGEDVSREPLACVAGVVDLYPLPYGGMISSPVVLLTLSTQISSLPILTIPRDTAVTSNTGMVRASAAILLVMWVT